MGGALARSSSPLEIWPPAAPDCCSGPLHLRRTERGESPRAKALGCRRGSCGSLSALSWRPPESLISPPFVCRPGSPNWVKNRWNAYKRKKMRAEERLQKERSLRSCLGSGVGWQQQMQQQTKMQIQM